MSNGVVLALKWYKNCSNKEFRSAVIAVYLYVLIFQSPCTMSWTRTMFSVSGR